MYQPLVTSISCKNQVYSLLWLMKWRYTSWWIHCGGYDRLVSTQICDSFSFGSILGLEYEEQYEMLVKYKTSLDLGLTEG